MPAPLVLSAALLLPPSPAPVGLPALTAASEPAGPVEAPHVRQETLYTCGPACLRSTLQARGLSVPPEAELARELGTTPEDGTGPDELAAGARRRGLPAEVREGLALRDLARAVRERRTAIVLYRSGGEGHWSVLKSIDARTVVLMDPYEDAESVALPTKAFARSWRSEHRGRPYRRAAVVVGP